MAKTNQFSADLFTEAQWKWIEQKYREGYFVKDLAEFLGVHRETLRRNLQRRGVKPMYRDEMPPLSEMSAEFNDLGR